MQASLQATVAARPCAVGGRSSGPALAPAALQPSWSPAARRGQSVAARAIERTSESLTRAASTSDLEEQAPFLEPFLRSFILGVGAGALLEGGHVAMQVLAGSFPGVNQYSPLLVADHVTAFASWIALYAIEAAAVMTVLKRCNYDSKAAAKDLTTLTTLPKKMLPLRMNLFKRFFAAGKQLQLATDTAGAPAAPAVHDAVLQVTADVPDVSEGASTSTGIATKQQQVVRAPQGAANGVVPAPKLRPATEAPPAEQDSSVGKRQKELHDRRGYLKNMWYAAALSEKVGKSPVQVQLCGKEMVLFRDETGTVQCIDNACPHRGAPLSEGWVGSKEGHSCVVCPYHGWALDGQGTLRDVPAAAHKGEWPKRSLVDSFPVEEKGGFVWLFYGSKSLPAEERPPIPYVAQLDDPDWKAVYEEFEFECGHHGVFENAIDMAHIHYLHNDSFGNQGKPEIRDMQTTTDGYSVTATFRIHNKPVNAFWALFQTPEVFVTARAFLPCTSEVTFTLGNGLSFTTFVSTVPISATRSVNRFALVRRLDWDKAGLANSIFNLNMFDGAARKAMIKIQTEDKAMVEKLRYDLLPAEYSVRADLPQIAFRKLRQQWVDLGYLQPSEVDQPPFSVSNRTM